jgi:hypothetical protein
MIEEWDQGTEDDLDDDLVCMNGNRCDHPCCPEHSDPEDSQPSSATEQLVADLWRFIEDVSEDDPERIDKFFRLRERVRCYYAGESPSGGFAQ